MALEIRPNCEMCDRDLVPAATDAYICSYECTYCVDCVAKLANVCPNCGGGFQPRPIRVAVAWREGVSLQTRPASFTRRHLLRDPVEVSDFVERIRAIPPESR